MLDPVDLSYAIGLPPEDAINYFRSKGYTFSWNWHDVWQEAHAKSFTVAKAMKLDLLQDIRNAVDKALANGTTLATFRDELEPLLKAKGWWGKDAETGAQLGSGHRLETIFRTNLQSSYMAGRYKQQMENADDRPYWQYVSVMDSRTRPAHAELNGKVFRFDDPFWNTHYPPLGFNCRCRTRALSEKNIKDRGLTVESGEGNMVWEEKPINKTTSRSVSGYKDPKTGKITFTDVGWSSNPGKEHWQIDLSKYDSKLQSVYKTDVLNESQSEFIKAKSVNKAKEWALNNYAENILFNGKKDGWGLKITDKYELLNKFNEVNRAIYEFKSNYPNFDMPKIKTVYLTSDRRGLATLSDFKSASVTFADDWHNETWVRAAKWEKDNRRPWDWVKEESHIATNVRHEIAHIIDGHFNISNNNRRYLDIYNKYKDDWAKNNISNYSATNEFEFFAEIFSQYTSRHYSKYRSFPKEITDFIDDILTGRGGFVF